MTTPLPPGWYPDPSGTGERLYWDGRGWHSDRATAQEPPRRRKRGFGRRLFWAAVIAVGIFWLLGQCGGTQDSSQGGRSPTSPKTSDAPDPYEYMEGNGTFKMGMAHDWGIWESDGATGVVPGRNCKWSIVSVARYRPGIVLDEGEAPPGERVTVNIQPDGPTNWDTIGDDNHQLVFATNNCGAWTWQR